MKKIAGGVFFLLLLSLAFLQVGCPPPYGYCGLSISVDNPLDVDSFVVEIMADDSVIASMDPFETTYEYYKIWDNIYDGKKSRTMYYFDGFEGPAWEDTKTREYKVSVKVMCGDEWFPYAEYRASVSRGRDVSIHFFHEDFGEQLPILNTKCGARGYYRFIFNDYSGCDDGWTNPSVGDFGNNPEK